ncbi:hypothetical protein B0H11DRAFT_2203149 [Mycena galericulata]|nr:hypothetical protein B0H11DRAFT_2203149 [Mycena galericulata]
MSLHVPPNILMACVFAKLGPCASIRTQRDRFRRDYTATAQTYKKRAAVSHFPSSHQSLGAPSACISQESMMAVPPSAAPDVFRGSDESGIHWSTVDGEGWSHECPLRQTFWSAPPSSIGRCGNPLRSAARRVNTPPVPQDLKILLARCGFADISTYSLSPTAGLQDFKTFGSSMLGRPLSLDSSTFGRPALQDSWCSDGISSTLLAPSMLGV